MANPDDTRKSEGGSTKTVEEGSFEKERVTREDGRYAILYSFQKRKEPHDRNDEKT